MLSCLVGSLFISPTTTLPLRLTAVGFTPLNAALLASTPPFFPGPLSASADSVFIWSPKTELILVITDLRNWSAHLSDHPVPDASDQLPVLAVGDQVEVVGKLDVAGQLLQDVDAEAFAAELGVGLGVAHDAGTKQTGVARDSALIDFQSDHR